MATGKTGKVRDAKAADWGGDDGSARAARYKNITAKVRSESKNATLERIRKRTTTSAPLPLSSGPTITSTTPPEQLVAFAVNHDGIRCLSAATQAGSPGALQALCALLSACATAPSHVKVEVDMSPALAVMTSVLPSALSIEQLEAVLMCMGSICRYPRGVPAEARHGVVRYLGYVIALPHGRAIQMLGFRCLALLLDHQEGTPQSVYDATAVAMESLHICERAHALLIECDGSHTEISRDLRLAIFQMMGNLTSDRMTGPTRRCLPPDILEHLYVSYLAAGEMKEYAWWLISNYTACHRDHIEVLYVMGFLDPTFLNHHIRHGSSDGVKHLLLFLESIARNGNIEHLAVVFFTHPELVLLPVFDLIHIRNPHLPNLETAMHIAMGLLDTVKIYSYIPNEWSDHIDRWHEIYDSSEVNVRIRHISSAGEPDAPITELADVAYKSIERCTGKRTRAYYDDEEPSLPLPVAVPPLFSLASPPAAVPSLSDFLS
jgi:hypothetical protein